MTKINRQNYFIFIFTGSCIFLLALFWTQLFFKGPLKPYPLPQINKEEIFKTLKHNQSSFITDKNNNVIKYINSKNAPKSIYKNIDNINPDIIKFVVFLEDAKFFNHKGMDFLEIGQSLKNTLQNNKKLRGASTISQQVIKNVFLDQKKNITRKIYEIPWTLALEKKLKKKEILEIYLNIIEWGPNIKGVEIASQYYFNKSNLDLSLHESLLLALIIPSPSLFNPQLNKKALKRLRYKKNLFLNRASDEKFLSNKRIQQLEKSSLYFIPLKSKNRKYFFSISNTPLANLINYYYKASKSRQMSLNWPLQTSWLKKFQKQYPNSLTSKPKYILCGYSPKTSKIEFFAPLSKKLADYSHKNYIIKWHKFSSTDWWPL